MAHYHNSPHFEHLSKAVLEVLVHEGLKLPCHGRLSVLINPEA